MADVGGGKTILSGTSRALKNLNLKSNNTNSDTKQSNDQLTKSIIESDVTNSLNRLNDLKKTKQENNDKEFGDELLAEMFAEGQISQDLLSRAREKWGNKSYEKNW